MNVFAKLWFVLAIAGFIFGCSKQSSKLPVSDQNGTERIFATNQIETSLGIVRAFKDHRYCGMILKEAANFLSAPADWRETNGLVLFSFHEPISLVPLKSGGSKKVPYIASFHIVVAPIGTNKTKVTVRTISSEIIGGKEINIHGGWANRYQEVSPIRSEEENVLKAISEELRLPL